jgi:hypothetical protein
MRHASGVTAPSSPGSPATRAGGTLLLADISGYTRFLQGVADAHRSIVIEADEPPAAFALVSSLLDAIVTTVAPPFRLAKLEGDAVFAVAADADIAAHGGDVIGCLRACHAAFSARLGEANDRWSCRCGACAHIDDLGLKFVLHHGEYVVQRIAGQEELLGSEVNLVHRLLKNHAVELIGPRPYALLTDALVDALRVPVEGAVPTIETYPDIPAVRAVVLPLA